MRIYSDPIEMAKEVERDLYEMGVEYQSYSVQNKKVFDNTEYRMRELIGYSYMLHHTNEFYWDVAITYLGGNKIWCSLEFSERISSTHINPGMSWLEDSVLWKQYLNTDNKFDYTYNERISKQIQQIISTLQQIPNSRQAILTIYDFHDDFHSWNGTKRVPCSMYYHFLLRDNCLNVIYNQRSCDFLKHFIHDSYLAYKMMCFIAEKIQAEPGDLIHTINSLHAFNIDLEKRNIF